MAFGEIFRWGYFQNADTQCVDWRRNRGQKDNIIVRLEEMFSFDFVTLSLCTFTRKLIKEPFLLSLCLSVEIEVSELGVRRYLKEKIG